MPSPPGWREVPCVECGTPTAGIDFGERCRACYSRRKKRVARLTRLISLGATGLTAVWVLISPPVSSVGRWSAIIGIAATYVLVSVIVSRIAMEVLP